MAPSCTDQNAGFPSQPSSDFPSKIGVPSSAAATAASASVQSNAVIGVSLRRLGRERHHRARARGAAGSVVRGGVVRGVRFLFGRSGEAFQKRQLTEIPKAKLLEELARRA